MTETRTGPSATMIWGAFATTALIWGSTFLFISVGNETVPALWAASLRLLLAAPVLTTIAFATGAGLPSGAAWRAAAGYGFFSLGLNMGLLYWGEKAVPSGLTAVLYATTPLTTALLTAGFGLERLSRARLGGAIVALAGVAVIYAGSLQTRVPAVPLIAVTLATVCGSLGAVMLKRGPAQSAFGANALGSMVGLIVCLTASFALGEDHALPRTAAAWGPVLYLTVAGSVGAFVLFSWLVKQWPVSRVAFVSVIVPVIALVLGALVRHERVATASLVGTGLVLAGVVIGLRGHGAARH